MSPKWGSKPRRTDRLVVGRNVTLTWGKRREEERKEKGKKEKKGITARLC
jgi:hypothetical protein